MADHECRSELVGLAGMKANLHENPVVKINFLLPRVCSEQAEAKFCGVSASRTGRASARNRSAWIAINRFCWCRARDTDEIRKHLSHSE
ncbi:hypothetical protein K788_0000815 [Paraburkholderia caribensis MBA4]|uniref:Uncharacterized protein n=1 Tax=Paraburkholderia caribensis MBA4 TaxID=1323664 RepID=A0A0P0RHP5_9BURK|nr:hypothetical protein K788_0000815 [Paraburkholderia caribensis MBA4]